MEAARSAVAAASFARARWRNSADRRFNALVFRSLVLMAASTDSNAFRVRRGFALQLSQRVVGRRVPGVTPRCRGIASPPRPICFPARAGRGQGNRVLRHREDAYSSLLPERLPP